MEEISLPTKTKIAAWWMIGISIIFGCIGLGLVLLGIFLPPGTPDFRYYFFIIGIGIIIGCLIVFPPSLFLLKRKRWAWWFSIIILILALCPFLTQLLLTLPFFGFSWIHLFYIVVTVPLLFPLILLLLDRKNFWKIAT